MENPYIVCKIRLINPLLFFECCVLPVAWLAINAGVCPGSPRRIWVARTLGRTSQRCWMSSRCRKGVGLGCFVVCAFRIISDTKIFGKISSSSSEKYFHYLIYPPSNIHLNITSGFTCWNCVKELSSSIVRSWVGSGRWWFHPQLQDVSGCFIHNFRWENLWKTNIFRMKTYGFHHFSSTVFFDRSMENSQKSHVFSVWRPGRKLVQSSLSLPWVSPWATGPRAASPWTTAVFEDFKHGEMLTNNSRFGCFFKEYRMTGVKLL